MSKKMNKGGSGMTPPDDGSPFRGAGSHIQHSIQELIMPLVMAACLIADAVAGRAQLSSLVTSAFYAKFGEAMRIIEVKLEQLAEERQFNIDDLKTTRNRSAETPAFLPTARVNSREVNDEPREVKWSEWQMRDRIEVVVLIILLPLALGASMVTAHANLAATSLPVFTEHDLLAWTMAAMAPASGLVVKLIASGFRTYKARLLFARVLGAIAVCFIITWTLLYADLFHGLGSGDTINDLFAEPTYWQSVRDTVFVAVTLLTEICIGAVLADRLDRIVRTYAPNYWFGNPESEVLEKRISNLFETVTNQTEEEARLQGELAEYQHSLKLQIELAQMAYDARRARFDEGNLS